MPEYLRPDGALLALRPHIAATVTPDDTPAARFAHGTLRPVLKLQNDVLLRIVASFVRDHHIPLATASATEQQRLLAELLTRNTKLRYTIIGLVTGLFTLPEWETYHANRPELNRRLLELATRRVQDQAGAVAVLIAE
ncbi:hypothetical protein [Hymenobacter endophyticus]|uniref:Uncharacterized protein n=1 Tax=Hymenobacter endophyticus TaxID=3076335 RepID=A0ABU3TE09_9BACT|nr:hypothetical protein [Hymenobacter endophyticus]MDU0369611.1 hypothetical protein [Hymenobacter endophyticus]